MDFDINPTTLELKVNIPVDASDNGKKKSSANTGGGDSYYSDVENSFDYDSRTIPSKFSMQKYIYDSNEVIHQEPDYVNISLNVICLSFTCLA